MTAPLKGSRASCNLDRGETETRCVEASDEQFNFAATLLRDCVEEESPGHWLHSDGSAAELIAARDSRLAAQTVPASKLMALVGELEFEAQWARGNAASCERARDVTAVLVWNTDASRLENAAERIRDLLPKPEEKTE